MTLIDFMPVRGRNPDCVRIVQGERGRVTMCVELVLRFGYGAIVPWVRKLGDGTLRAIAGPDMVVLRTPVHLRGENMTTVGEFTVGEGDRVPFVLSYGPSHLRVPEAFAADAALQDTESYWIEWTRKGQVRRPLEGRGHALAHHAQGADLRRRPAASWRRRPRRCPSGSAATATGTTASAGCATRR